MGGEAATWGWGSSPSARRPDVAFCHLPPPPTSHYQALLYGASLCSQPPHPAPAGAPRGSCQGPPTPGTSGHCSPHWI